MRRPRQQQRQRPRPKGRDQLARRVRDLLDQPVQHIFVGHMHNDGVPRRPLLGRKDTLNRRRIQRVRTQSINRLGGQRHEAASAQNTRCLLQRILSAGGIKVRWVDDQSQCLHLFHCRLLRATAATCRILTVIAPSF